jgi:hypothetical protein
MTRTNHNHANDGKRAHDSEAQYKQGEEREKKSDNTSFVWTCMSKIDIKNARDSTCAPCNMIDHIFQCAIVKLHVPCL